MGTATITPPVSAPAAPASTPAPATSTPTPAPAATPTPTPTPPAEPTGDSGLDRIRAGWAKAKETVAAGEEEPAGEEPAAEPPAVEEPTTEEPATEEAAGDEPEAEPVAAEPVAEEVPELDDGTTLSPQDFAKAVKGTETEKFLNEHPEIKGPLFQALREVNEAREIRALVPDVETARVVTQAAASWQGIDNKFLAATTPEGADGFLESWAREALIVGDDGKPKLDAQGKYQFHPALNTILNKIADNRLALLMEQAEATGDDRLKTALEIIREVSSPSSPGLDDVSEELKPQADAIKAERAKLDAEKAERARQESESARVANEQSIERAEKSVSTAIQRQLEPSFKKSGLSAFEAKAALARIGEAIDAELGTLNEDGSWQPGGNKLFQSIYDNIISQAPSEARETALKAHYLKFANPRLGRIAAQVIREAKAGTLERQTSRTSTVAAQKRDSATEPRGASITPPSSHPQTAKEVRAQIIEQYKSAHNGQEPEASYVLAEVLKREGARLRA